MGLQLHIKGMWSTYIKGNKLILPLQKCEFERFYMLVVVGGSIIKVMLWEIFDKILCILTVYFDNMGISLAGIKRWVYQSSSKERKLFDRTLYIIVEL